MKGSLWGGGGGGGWPPIRLKLRGGAEANGSREEGMGGRVCRDWLSVEEGAGGVSVGLPGVLYVLVIAGDVVPQYSYHCLCGPNWLCLDCRRRRSFHRPGRCREVIKSLLQSLRIHKILPEASGTFRS